MLARSTDGGCMSALRGDGGVMVSATQGANPRAQEPRTSKRSSLPSLPTYVRHGARKELE